MPHRFATRVRKAHKSFIREILKVTDQPEIISFAGGLPLPDLFPCRGMERAAVTELSSNGQAALQYATTEGYAPLREWIAKRYQERHGMEVTANDVVITTGSQQALDLAAKVFINPGDTVLVERPGYLGAIQSFSLFEPVFATVDLQHDGPDLNALAAVLGENQVKLFYAVPTFQNPSGLSYSREKREAVAGLLASRDTLLVEDNPYGELRFAGEECPPLAAFLGLDKALLMGSFSKIVSPGLRVGWLLAPEHLRDKIVLAKQAADLHTSTLTQRVLHRYLTENSIDEHIATIRERYGEHCRLMLAAIDRHFPPEVRCTRPEGGMFLWGSLPEGYDSMDLFNLAIENKVAFVPGRPFYVDGSGENTFRLNFSNANPERIEEGIARLGRCLAQLLEKEEQNQQ